MKKIFTCLVLLLPVIVYGQKIHFTDSVNNWSYRCVDYNTLGNFITTYQYSGDTVCNGLTYRKMEIINAVLIREDTVAGKVYTKNYMDDTSEQLLYDYTLQLGDTLRTNIYNAASGTHQLVISVVTQYDSVLQNNAWYKRWHFKRVGAGFSFTVIEGVGAVESFLFTPYLTSMDEVWCKLCALYQDTTYVFGSDAYCRGVGIEEQNHKAPLLITMPNPCAANDRMLFSDAARGGRLRIYSAGGQQVADLIIADTYIIPGHYISLPGMYFYSFSTNKGQAITGKFLLNL